MSVYSAGWLLDDSGVAQLHELGAIAVPSSAIFMNGFAFDSSGRLYTQAITTAVPATAVYNSGVARRPDGAAYVRYDTPSSTQFIAGNLVSSDGALCVSLTPDASPVYLRGINHKSTGRIVVAVGDYETTANDYDGTNDYQTRGADLTGITDAKTGTLSLWIRIDTLSIARLMASANETPTRFQAITSVGATYQITATNAAGTTILDISTAQTFSAGATWIHLLSSWNLATAGARHIYVNDVSDLVQTTFTNDTIDYTRGNWAIGGSTTGATKFNGCLSEVFFHNTYIDLSVESNRRKFILASGKPAFLGTNGSVPLGVQPLIYAPNGDASTNKGSGGNFTTTGSLDACSTSPSD